MLCPSRQGYDAPDSDAHRRIDGTDEMASPLGHLLMGGAVGAAFAVESGPRRSIAAGALAAILPDLDFLPGALVGEPARFHHAVTHSVAFVVVAAVIVFGLTRSHAVRWAVIVGLAYGSHLLLDWITLDDGAPIGIPLFWPISSDAFASPIPLLPRVPHSAGQLMTLEVLRLGLLELLLFGAVFLLVARRLRRRIAQRLEGEFPGGDSRIR